MAYTIGIDLGGTATKLVACAVGGNPVAWGKLSTRPEPGFAAQAASDFLAGQGIGREEVECIVLTGVRTSFLTQPLLGLPTYTVPELEAIGWGGLAASGLKRALVVSMGTGTALVLAGPEGRSHLGGSGIGGGTLCGLGQLLLGERDGERIGQLAVQGRPEKVDLLMRDICRADIPTLQPELTAANFGKLDPEASRADLALGLVTMILQSVGCQAAFAARGIPIQDIVLTGALTLLGQSGEMFAFMGEMFGLRFHIPARAEFATALGSVLCPQRVWPPV